MDKGLKRVAGLILFAAGISLPGCVTPFDFAANAGLGIAQAGTSSFIQGTLQAAVDRSMNDVFDAAKRAMKTLGYESSREDLGEHYAQLQATQSDGSSIVIKLKKSSPVVTGISIRVGLWGDNAVSRLIFHEIEKDLGVKDASQPEKGQPAFSTPP